MIETRSHETAQITLQRFSVNRIKDYEKDIVVHIKYCSTY